LATADIGSYAQKISFKNSFDWFKCHRHAMKELANDEEKRKETKERIHFLKIHGKPFF
jgi:hypothetical protein